MLRAFTKLLNGPAFEAMRIREENAAIFIDGLISEKEKLHMQIKLMGIRIREQRKHLRKASERADEYEAEISELKCGIERHRRVIMALEEAQRVTKKKTAKKKAK